MILYICFSTGGKGHHPCSAAYEALKAAGYNPELQKVYGSGFLPRFLQGKRRRKLKTMTGDYHTPVLELDDGTIINPSGAITAWAKAHPRKVKPTQ